MDNGIKGDAVQAVAVMKNEIKKFLRGNRILVFGVLFALFNAMIIAAVLLFGDSIVDGMGIGKMQVFGLFVAMTAMTALIAAVLFSATSIVSEFQERTALILFTRPIRKRAIFVGKFLASFAVTAAFIIVYYIIAVVFTQMYAGGLPSGIPDSFAAAICFVFAMTGLSFLVSSVAKKGSTASIVTLIIYLVILGTISSIAVVLNLGDPWWNMPDAASAITAPILGGSVDLARSCGVLVVWGLLAAMVSYFLFKRRDF